MLNMKPGLAIYWFRQDLRLSDKPALCWASQHEYVLPIYILDDENPGMFNRISENLGGLPQSWIA